MEHIYIAIDLKSFYASVECRELGLDPLDTNLVVADKSRTEKTICLAVSPSLKSFGIPGRPRLYQVVEQVKKVNATRRMDNGGKLRGQSHFYHELIEDGSLELSYIVMPPRMAYYIKYSTEIYKVYLKYVAAEDIHVYSIDEVFLDVTKYLPVYKMSAHDLAMTIIKDVLDTVGITATAGIGSNLYLAKVAMDIVAKHVEADEDGVRIARLDEKSYRRLLWNHRPITDFWRVGRGYAKKLEKYGMFTMGDVAKCSLGDEKQFHNEKLLYDLFGVNAELLIDHAWGYEPCSIVDIKAYKPKKHGIGAGQVLQDPYTYKMAETVTREMIDSLVLDLVSKGLVSNQAVITVGYDVENLKNEDILSKYRGEIIVDNYGRQIPKYTRFTVNFNCYSSSTNLIVKKVMEAYEVHVNKDLFVRRIDMSLNNVIERGNLERKDQLEQLNFFMDLENIGESLAREDMAKEKEKNIQEAILEIKDKYGKNAILKGTGLKEGATAKSRNKQIGGHRA